jgi:signal peptidase I
MGDNRVVSKDSRSSEIGFVSTDKIVGKILFRITPVSDFGFIE